MLTKKSFLLIGNSRWHWAIQKENVWEFFHTKPNTEKPDEIDFSLLKWSAVGSIPKNNYLLNCNKITLEDIPLKNLPEWLGIDRALAAYAAKSKISNIKNHNENILIVDAGTILSITLITQEGEFLGGQLVGGFKLQISAMANRAYNLEYSKIDHNITNEIFPKKTKDAMERGSLNALVGLIIESYKHTKSPILICGGDSHLIYKELLNKDINIYIYPNLVLEGMINL